MTTYKYTIYDGNPASAADAWPDHDDEEFEADSDEEALAEVRDRMEILAAGLSAADGYEVGQHLYAHVAESETERYVGAPTYELTEDDLA